MLKYICSLLVVIILGVVGFLFWTVLQDGAQKYTVPVKDVEIPQFTQIEVGFVHHYDGSRDMPFMAGAVIDVDNDGVEELFLGGGVLQADGLFLFKQDHFVNIADQVGLVKQGDDATFGAVVLDVDRNGYSDLLISRKSGVWLYRNNGKRFNGVRINAKFSANVVPLSVAVADLNGDDHVDIFVPAYPVDLQAMPQLLPNSRGSGENKLLINNGDDSFTDITDPAGLGYERGGMQAIFVDIDQDSLEDLVVLYTEGKIRTWKNRGTLLFENKKHFLSDTFGLFMGFGVADYNNDGKVDFFFTNSGSTVPQFLAKVELEVERRVHSQWTMMRNMGGFSFQDDAEKAKLANYELSRGATFADLNLDGLPDLVVSQNHQNWTPHRLSRLRLAGRLFVQNLSGEFVETATASGVINRSFSIAPLVADFNQDGRPDIIHINMDGYPKVFLSKRGENNFLKIKLADTVRSLGAVVRVTTFSGKVYEKQFLVGKQLCSDSSHVLFFGLAKDKVAEVVVNYKNGETIETTGVLFNSTVVFK